jgi:methylated-DNA-[protein]-cysteine S-methyltransferase
MPPAIGDDLLMETDRAKLPETFGLDRLDTPIGVALLVSDDDGVLRALDWEDYEARMRELLRLQYGAVVMKEARAPRDLRTALAGYFKGDFDRLRQIKWRVAGTPFQQKVWNPISVVVPCHRLIGANGSLIKYGGGLQRKRWLLQHEGVEV